MSGIHLSGVALITGAGSGIGRETAFAFAEAGATAVVFADINLNNAQAAAERSKSFASNPEYEGIAAGVDVRDLHSVEALVKATAKRFGRIDYNVNSAGVDVQKYESLMEASVEDYENVMNVNARGIFYTMREVIKVMQGQSSQAVRGRNGERDVGKGSIVNIGSSLSFTAVPGKLPYISSKHALMGMTKSAAIENSASGIRVNALLPSWTVTGMYEGEKQKVPQTPDIIKAIVPGGRPALPEEVAEVAVFLCSSSASYICGIGIPIDAGLTLTVH